MTTLIGSVAHLVRHGSHQDQELSTANQPLVWTDRLGRANKQPGSSGSNGSSGPAPSAPPPSQPPPSTEPAHSGLPVVPRFTSKGSTFKGQMTMLAVGVGLSLLVFLALPFTQKISSTGLKHQFFQSMDLAKPPPPPPPNDPPPPKEEQRPEEKPELQREQPLLTLSQLEAVLNPGFGGAAVGDFSLNLSAMAADDLSRIFELTEIDRVPQPIVQVAPVYPFALSRAGITGRVEILFVVTPQGTVRDPRVVYSSRVEFEKPALDAVMRWRFEPGIKSGTRVAVRMQLPFTFNVSD